MTSLPSKMCSKCHLDKPLVEFHKDSHKADGHVSRCKDCRNLDSRTSNQENPEQAKAHQDRYRNKNRTKINSQARSYRKASPEKSRSTVRKYHTNNSSRPIEQITADRERLRPGGTKVCRTCKQTQVLADFYSKKRNADGLTTECKQCFGRKRRMKIETSFKDRKLVSCVYCGGLYEHIEHVLCLYLGGSDDLTNLVPSCAHCNLIKGISDPWTWMEKMFPSQDHQEILDSWGISWRNWN